MCRIAGIISLNDPYPVLREQVQTMCDSMAHGGPDDEGLSTDTNTGFVFGHRRLSLIDLSPAGHQPMYYQDVSLTFNGEIYNYLLLKEELLQNGYIFTTASDTEVILAGYTHWGTAVFAKLKGMFAFALYDKKTDSTYLVRDQSGIKPLYYCVQADRLIFASEVKAFTTSNYTFEENKDWKTYFLAFGYLPHPFTTLNEVYALTNGCFLKWDHQTATHQIINFDQSSPADSIENKEEATAVIKKALTDAVKNHLIADAPVGVFLSGGIDSSVITLLANTAVGENLKTLSINFAEEAFSEAKYQQLIASQTTGTHTSYLVTQKDLEANFDQILAAMDQPSNDAINSWFVNKCAKENGLKAVLSGIGADELFGGYPSFKRMRLVKALKCLPKFILRWAEKLPSEKLNRIYFLSYSSPIGEYLFLRGFFSPSAIAKILQIPKKDIDLLLMNFPLDNSIEKLKDGERASWMETNLFMKNQLLKDTDFMSMAHGIEVRVPFLDQDLLKVIDQISSQLKFKTKYPKGLLIDAFKDILPEAIWNRPKMGFTFPLQDWLRKNKKITNSDLYAKNDFAAIQMEKFKAGELHWSKAYALFQVFRG